VIGGILGLAALSGCTGGYGSQAATEPLRIPNTEGSKAFDAALAVLGRMHFTIDKADPNTGLIRTHPLPAAQFFELWRSDNVTVSDQLEANLNTLRRTAWLAIVPVGEDVSIDCLVRVERLNVPSRPVVGSATAYRSLSDSTVIAQSLRVSPEQQQAMEWTDLGTDPPLASRILAGIAHRMKKTSPQSPSKG
jgi:hypothetical protein